MKDYVNTIEEIEKQNKENEKSYIKRIIGKNGFPFLEYDKEQISELINKIYDKKKENENIADKKGSSSFILDYIYRNQEDYKKDLSTFLNKIYENKNLEFLNDKSINLNLWCDINYNNFSKYSWYETDWVEQENTIAFAFELFYGYNIIKKMDVVDEIYSFSTVEKYIYHLCKKFLFSNIFSTDTEIEHIDEIIKKIKNLKIENILDNNKLQSPSKANDNKKDLNTDFLLYLFKLWDNNILKEEINFLNYLLQDLNKNHFEITIMEEKKFSERKMTTNELLSILRFDLKSQKDNEINLKLEKIRHFF